MKNKIIILVVGIVLYVGANLFYWGQAYYWANNRWAEIRREEVRLVGEVRAGNTLAKEELRQVLMEKMVLARETDLSENQLKALDEECTRRIVELCN